VADKAGDMAANRPQYAWRLKNKQRRGRDVKFKRKQRQVTDSSWQFYEELELGPGKRESGSGSVERNIKVQRQRRLFAFDASINERQKTTKLRAGHKGRAEEACVKVRVRARQRGWGLYRGWVRVDSGSKALQGGERKLEGRW